MVKMRRSTRCQSFQKGMPTNRQHPDRAILFHCRLLHIRKTQIQIFLYPRHIIQLAALDDLGSETELCPSKLLGSRTDTKLLYQDGEVFFLDGEDCVVRFALADVYRGDPFLFF